MKSKDLIWIWNKKPTIEQKMQKIAERLTDNQKAEVLTKLKRLKK